MKSKPHSSRPLSRVQTHHANMDSVLSKCNKYRWVFPYVGIICINALNQLISSPYDIFSTIFFNLISWPGCTLKPSLAWWDNQGICMASQWDKCTLCIYSSQNDWPVDWCLVKRYPHLVRAFSSVGQSSDWLFLLYWQQCSRKCSSYTLKYKKTCFHDSTSIKPKGYRYIFKC